MSELKKVDLDKIAERLKLIRGKLSRDKFSDLLGVHRNTLGNYENAVRTLGADMLIGLTDIGINPMWVLKGEGDILIPESELGPAYVKDKEKQVFYHKLRSHLQGVRTNPQRTIKQLKSSIYRKQDQNIESGQDDPTLNPEVGSEVREYTIGSGRTLDAFTRIPLYDATASAGKGSYVLDESTNDSLIFKKEWIHNELHNSPGNLYLINIEGESMEPSLRPGDVVLVDHSDNTAKRDGIYVLRMGDALLVKRLQRLPGDIIKASSDNPAYEPFNIDLKKDGHEISIIGRVVWSGRRQ